MKTLRPYQDLGKQMVYSAFREGHRKVIYWMQTGAGKGTAACDFVQEMKDNHVVIVMRRRELIQQTSNNLDSWGLDHGIYMANHRRWRPSLPVQVCSIDTLDAREVYPKAHLVMVDESHDDTPKAKKYAALHAAYPDAYFVGFTATPFSDNSHYSEIICPITAAELRDQGWLVPEKTFVPSQINLNGVHVVRGEFDEKELVKASSGSQIVGEFIRDWRFYGQGRPTFTYAINIEHSKAICEAYQAAGINAVHCDAKTPTNERKRVLAGLKEGTIEVVVNVNLFSVGVDVPEVSCIQICRPTMSLIWHLQAIGRGLRTAPNKVNCMVIDHAGNTLRHGPVYYPREATLESKGKGSAEKQLVVKRCDQCGYVMLSSQVSCPDCGTANQKTERFIKLVDGQLVEYAMTPEELSAMRNSMLIIDYHKLRNVRRTRSLPEAWIYKTLIDKYGPELVQQNAEKINLGK